MAVQRRLRPVLCLAFLLAGLFVLEAPLALAQDKPKRIRAKMKTYPDPVADLSVPVVRPGESEPEFKGNAVLEVNRTGTYGGVLVYSFLAENETFNPVEPKGATAHTKPA